MPEQRCVSERRAEAGHILVSGQAGLAVEQRLMHHRSDLNCSIAVGSNRIVDHRTFSELLWVRDSSRPAFYILPPGFHQVQGILGPEFKHIMQDIHALQCIRNFYLFDEGAVTMAQIDNHQASVQSRLANMSSDSFISDCCRLAAYLCSTMLRCKLWRSSCVPVSGLHIFPRIFSSTWSFSS